MDKKKKTLILMMVLGVIMILLGSTFAYFSWRSGENKEVVFNTSKGLQEYIIYDSGESKFIGDFQVGTSYTSGVHTTVSIYKSDKISDKMLYATINMKVKEIGENLNNSEALKWTVTLGNATSNGKVLASGNFSLLSTGSEMAILPNFEVTTTLTEYTIWIWLDETLADSSMTGETADVSIWTQVDQIVVDKFEITKLTNNYQIIKAIAVNSGKKIIGYQVTDSNTEPSTWISIPENEQNNIYNLEYTVNNTGTYYIWFKDKNNKIISKSIEISEINNNAPTCTWSEFNPSTIMPNNTSKITLTCIDNVVGITDKNITKEDITISNNNIVVDTINKESVSNGYKYTFTITGNSEGASNITLPKDTIKNKVNIGNEEIISKDINVRNTLTLTIDYNGGTSSKTYDSSYPYDSVIELSNPTKEGYDFDGWEVVSGNGKVIRNTLLNGNFASSEGWSTSSTSIDNKLSGTVENNVLYIEDTSNITGYWNYQPVKFISGHKYYIASKIDIRSLEAGTVDLRIRNTEGDAATQKTISEVTTPRTSFVATADDTWYAYQIGISSVSIANGSFAENMVIDLTEAYGLGNEPTQEWLDQNISYINESTLITDNENIKVKAKWRAKTNVLTIDPNVGTLLGKTSRLSYYLTSGDIKNIPNPTREGYDFDGYEIVSGSGNIIRNMVINGNFEDGTNGWTKRNSETILTNVSSGGINDSKYIKLEPKGTYRWLYSSKHYIPLNHIVYTSAYYQKHGGGNTRLLVYDSDDNAFLARYDSTSDDVTEWTRVSARMANTTNYEEYSTLVYGASSEYVEGMYSLWDNVLTIDLTEAYGSGNEPTKEWLDQNIDYFDGSNFTMKDQETVIRAKWKAKKYTVNFNGNMFSTASKTINGLTITYDYDNSYLTINGTPTSTSTVLSSLTGLSFTSGNKYTMTLTYVSGSYAYTGTGSASFVADVTNTSNTALATRNVVSSSYPTSGSKSNTLTVSDLASTDGSGFKFWMWASEPAKQTFTNYKMKVNITKSDTKKVSYNSTYGSLPIPKRVGFTFDGWYTGEKGTGTKITDSTKVAITSDQTLYAKWKDNVLPYGTAALSLTNGKYTLKLSNYGDDGSGLTGTYGFALTTNSNCSAATYTNQTGVSKDYTGSYTNGTTYYGCIKLTDKAGNIAYLSSAGVKYSYTNVNQQYTTAGEQTYTVPDTGTYKLEVWGAQGGSTTYSSKTYRGGYGGYSVGSISLTKGQKLYINVGGAGKGGASSSTFAGGYNGGGAITQTNGSDHYHASGGGATHIATVSGLLSTLSSKTSNILIVAGGGGGGYVHTYSTDYTSIGGEGGGIKGTDSTTAASNGKQGLGGTQTAGGKYKGSSETTSTIFGSFGKGGTPSASWGSAGGGGYYGGGASYGETSSNGNTGGGGGSGYIGNSSLTNKAMYCYNCTTSTATATKTNTTTNVSSTPTANYAKSGAGAAKITATITTNVTSLVLTYNNNGGSGCYSKTIVKGGTYGTLCTPVRDGYSFDGWYTAATDGTKITSSTSVTVTANQTIYAHWTASTNPVITFSPNGNSSYVRGNVSSTINVSKGSNDLDSSTLKYIYSLSDNVSPSVEFIPGNSYSLNSATGKYYLIAQACDVNGKCTKKISSPFYVDNTKPEGNVLLSQYKSSITANVNATDEGSEIKNYGYLITTASSCPTSGYTTSTNAQYTLNATASGTYRVCVKITDKAGNANTISNTITVTITEITYGTLISSYSCSNKTVGSSPYIISYTGKCEIVKEGTDNWKIKFLTSGTLKISTNLNVDTFLVGGGAGGGASDYNNLSQYDSGTWWSHGDGGSGGYTKTYRNIDIKSSDTYTITVGSGGAADTAGGKSSLVGGSINQAANGGNTNRGAGGSGGGAGCTQYYAGGGGAGAGGKYGNAGGDCTGNVLGGSQSLSGGSGQGTTTCEFEQSASGSSTDLTGCATGITAYGAGGTAAGTKTGTANTGNGGDGASSSELNNSNTSKKGYAGGSGIVIIRNGRANPEVTFTPNGNTKYVNSVSVSMDVNKGYNNLDTSTYKYTFSKSRTATPDKSFTRGTSYTFSGLSGIYYLVAKACDTTGACTTQVSSAFYLDNTKPTASLSLTNSGFAVNATVSNVVDADSGLKNYGYLITTESTCPTSGYVTSTSSSYKFMVSESGTYRVCVKLTDNTGNVNYINKTIAANVTNSYYERIANSYRCSNISSGNAPYLIDYAGNCQLVDEGNGNWKLELLTSASGGSGLSISESIYVDIFMVGGGGGGGTATYTDLSQYDSDIWWYNGSGGGGGYTKTISKFTMNSETYTVTIGSGGAAGKDGGNTSLVGGNISQTANGGKADGGAGGSGGGGGCSGNGYGCTVGSGGKFGSSGVSGTGSNGGTSKSGGTGQGTTTCEFGQSTSGSNTDLTGCTTGITAYGAGGSAGGSKAGTANTGAGGDGANSNGLNGSLASRVGYAGGSGVVIIRNSRTNPKVTFTPNGNTKYVNSVSVLMDVNKGYNNLDTSTYKYTFSKSKTATPDKSFTRGNSYTFSDLSGIYYLIAQACDTTGSCATQVSKAFYLDNTKPTANLSLTASEFEVTAIVSNVVDEDSGLKNYGYLITTASSCPTSGYVTSTNSSYKFMVSESGTYRVCVKLTDNTGNVNYINSTTTTSVSSSYYERIANSYKCNNVSKGSSPYLITYDGNCELINDGNGNWRLKLLTSNSSGSSLSISESIYADIFMVGGGGGGGNSSYSDLRQYDSDEWWSPGSGGGGGYTKTIKKVTLGTSNYTITIGAGGAAGTDGGNTSLVGGNISQTANGGKASGGAGGSGGGAGCSSYSYGGGGTASGGKYGNAGGNCTGSVLGGAQSLSGGAGQGTTTCEFAQSANGSNTDLTGCATGVTAYGAGGTAAGSKAGTANTGAGGDGASATGLGTSLTSRAGYAGGSGIIIIRNAR